MGAHTDTLKQGYERFSNGDVEGATENWTDDFTWQGGGADDMPGGGEHKTDDGSGPYKPTPDFPCDPSQVLPGK